MKRELTLTPLRDLSAEKPTTKMGQIRWAWPEIQAALAAGHTLRRVHKRLEEIGIAIGYRTLSLYIGRLERREARQQAQPITAAGQPEKTNPPGEPAVPRPAGAGTSRAAGQDRPTAGALAAAGGERNRENPPPTEPMSAPVATSEHDPFANIREERKKKRVAFEYDPISTNKNLLE